MACEAQPNRASVFAVVSEDTCGVLKIISAASSFVPLRQGYSFSASVEEIASNELFNSLGQTKTYKGKEAHTGSHSAYLKNSETSSFPEINPILLNAFGTNVSRSSTYTVMDSTLTTIKINNNANNVMQIGEAILSADLTSGYWIRNIASISSDGSVVRLYPGFNTAPSLRATIAANNMYKQLESDHPTFSAWLFRGDGGSTEALSGCSITETSLSLSSNQQAEISFNYSGKKYYFNPIQITSSNSKIEFAAGSSTRIHFADITPKVYRTPQELADEIKTKMDNVSDDTFTISFNSFGDNQGKFNIESNGTTLVLRWQGTYSASSIGTKIGFNTNANDSGATSYLADNALSYGPRILSSDSALSPSYDNADNIILKNADCWIGTNTEVYLRKASTLSITMSTPTNDIDDMTSETGIYERVKSSREVAISATILFEKHEIGLFDKFIENKSLSFSSSFGDKDSNGNWVATKCVNVYAPNCKITQHSVSGDEILAIELNIKAFVSTTEKDLYLNFC